MTLTSPVACKSPDTRRWPLVVAAVSMQVCLGSAYAWSVFRTPLREGMGWSYEETATPFRWFLVAYALGLWVGGALQDRFGPRVVAMGAGLVLALGYGAAGLLVQGVVSVSVFYGLVGGLACGTAYATPVATLLRWFPDKKGLMGGLAVMGFGAGSLLFAPLIAWALGLGIHTGWVLAGVGLVVGSVVWVAGNRLALPQKGSSEGETELWGTRPAQTIRTWPYPALWIAFFCASAVGLSLINEASPLMERLTANDPTWFSPALAVGMLAVANGFGRIFWGQVSDRFGRRAGFGAMFTVMLCGALVQAQARHPQAALAAFLMVGLCFGGMFGMLPSAVSSLFGTRAFGSNYGMAYTAYALAALTVPGWVSVAIGSQTLAGNALAAHQTAFLWLAGLAALGLVCSFALRSSRVSHG